MTPEQEDILRRLGKKPEGAQTAKALKASSADVEALLVAGLVERVPPATKRQVEKLKLTTAGVEAARGLSPPRARAARRTRAGTDGIPARPTTKDLYQLILSLRDELRGLTARFASQQGNERTAAARPGPQEVDAALSRALREVDARGRHGGLVPIPEIRRELAPLGLTRADFDAALLERQRARTLELKVANDPRLVDDPEDGIRQEGRGLLYYVVVR